jgi:hypothetical protein
VQAYDQPTLGLVIGIGLLLVGVAALGGFHGRMH